jgi:hypothetical protein
MYLQGVSARKLTAVIRQWNDRMLLAVARHLAEGS